MKCILYIDIYYHKTHEVKSCLFICFSMAHRIINQPTMFTHLLTKENLLNNLS